MRVLRCGFRYLSGATVPTVRGRFPSRHGKKIGWTEFLANGVLSRNILKGSLRVDRKVTDPISGKVRRDFRFVFRGNFSYSIYLYDLFNLHDMGLGRYDMGLGRYDKGRFGEEFYFRYESLGFVPVPKVVPGSGRNFPLSLCMLSGGCRDYSGKIVEKGFGVVGEGLETISQNMLEFWKGLPTGIYYGQFALRGSDENLWYLIKSFYRHETGVPLAFSNLIDFSNLISMYGESELRLPILGNSASFYSDLPFCSLAFQYVSDRLYNLERLLEVSTLTAVLDYPSVYPDPNFYWPSHYSVPRNYIWEGVIFTLRKSTEGSLRYYLYNPGFGESRSPYSFDSGGLLGAAGGSWGGSSLLGFTLDVISVQMYSEFCPYDPAVSGGGILKYRGVVVAFSHNPSDPLQYDWTCPSWTQFNYGSTPVLTRSGYPDRIKVDPEFAAYYS